MDAEIRITGNLAADPEQRTTQGGATITRFSLAVTPRYKDKQGQWQNKDTSFFNCAAWDHAGNAIAKHFKKGDRMMACGQVELKKWADKQGVEHISADVTVREYALVPRTEKPAEPSSDSNRKPFRGPPPAAEPFDYGEVPF